MTTTKKQPIVGVFDSGVGGLTVLRELVVRVPGADYVYLGDTARLPYGSKSQQTVARYAVSSAQFLMEQGAQLLVIACNTASALALEEIRAACPIPVEGVIDPGADAAAAASTSRQAAVIATAATISSHAYAKALTQRNLKAIEKACPLFVPLIEEGWTDHTITRQVANIYLEELSQLARSHGVTPDVLVLGCTHYPLLKPLLRELLPPETSLVDSAEATADKVAEHFPQLSQSDNGTRVSLFATDSVERFKALGERFLGRSIDGVTLVDLGG
jgi:glutamate racemase